MMGDHADNSGLGGDGSQGQRPVLMAVPNPPPPPSCGATCSPPRSVREHVGSEGVAEDTDSTETGGDGGTGDG